MIEVDTHEPLDLVRLLDQAHEVEVKPLNELGWADFRWMGAYKYSNLERKTWRDIAQGADSVEEQLSHHLKNHPECINRLLIEGAIEPDMKGVLVYNRMSGKNIMTPFQVGNQPGQFKKIMGQVAGWSEYIEVFYSASYAASAILLSELYSRDNKPDEEKNTFRRYFKHIDWNPNPQVSRMLGMALNDTGLGPTRVESIIKEYGTVWNAIHATPADWARIPGIGVATARDFMRKIGRPDA